MKKLVVLLLTLALTLGVCTVGFAEDVPTLEVFLWDSPTPDADMVSDAISEITMELIGCRVHLNFIADGDYQQKLPLMLASNDQMDVVFDSQGLGYQTRAASGAYLELGSMLDTVAPTLKSTLTENQLVAATVGDGIYCIPSYKDMFWQPGMWIEKALADALEIDLDAVYSINDFEPWLEYIYADEAHKNSTLMLYGTNFNFPRAMMGDHFYYFAGANGYCLGVDKDDPSTIVNIYASEEYAAHCALAYSWYEKGYIREDVATIDNWGTYYTNGSGVGYGMKVGQYAPQGEVSNSLAYGGDIVFIKIGECVTSTEDVLGATWCVPAKTQYPELALKFIELLDTNADVQNLLSYGIAGVHYNLVDGQVQFVEGYADMYKTATYKCGDQRVRYLLVGEAPTKNEEYEFWNSNAIPSPFMGFVCDMTPVQNTMANCYTVIQEYAKLLGNGAVDPEVYLPMFLTALEEAGINEVIAEVQAQYDAFRAA